MSNTINVNYMTRAYNQYQQKNAAKDQEKEDTRFADSVREKSEASGSIVGNSKIGSVSAKDMTMVEYKQYIYNKISQIPMHPTRAGESISVTISEAGFEAMKNDPEYEAWVLNDLQVGWSQPDKWSGICGGAFSTIYYGASKEECHAEMWSAGYNNGNGGKIFNDKSKNSFWERRIENKNRIENQDRSYINLPMNKEEYENFYNILINAPKIELKEFEKNAKFFESCLPIEVLASRGVDTLRFGPMKPVGLVDKRTGEKNYAVVQLRQDNSAKTLFNLVGFQTNLKWGAQKELLQAIPGLENVNIVRYGVMHRNTFINSPKILNASLQTRKRKDLFFAGQLTGTEGYTESIATGMLAGINMARLINGEDLLILPKETMLGALTQYISDENHEKFQPINSNWGIVSPVELPKKERKNKKLKAELISQRSIEYLTKIR